MPNNLIKTQLNCSHFFLRKKMLHFLIKQSPAPWTTPPYFGVVWQTTGHYLMRVGTPYFWQKL